MKARTFVVLAALLSVTAVTGVTAFTSATVARDASVSITADNNAIIGLQPGEGAQLNSSGVLVIDLEGENLNQNATFTYGDTSSPTTAYAFNITNNDDTSHSFTFTHNGPSALTYQVYDDSGSTNVMTLSDGQSKSVTINSGLTYYVVIEVDTGRTTGTQSGGLEISV
ncbi:MAG: hypothetical protein ABEJ71_01540 [Halodesulfurarchaeum sp.]